MAICEESESLPSDLEAPMVRESPCPTSRSLSDGTSPQDERAACPGPCPARFCTWCIKTYGGIVVFVPFGFIGASIFRRDFSILASAAWSFIFFFPLLQVLFPCCRPSDEEIEVKYQLSGNVVDEKARENLKASDRDLLEESAMETSGMKKNAEHWCEKHIDAVWYRAGGFSLCFTILKAILNIYSVISTPIQENLLTRDRNEPGWLGSTWVASIEIPYMLLFLLPYFVCTGMQLRGWCTELDHERKVRALVRLSGLLKSLGRFSALNLLEFIRLDDFIQQDRMQKVTSVISAVIGFMAFRVKVSHIAFVVNQHTLAWTFAQWIRVFALINNMLSIADLRNKMIFASVQTKGYRKDRWLEAVGDHLWTDELQTRVRESLKGKLSWPGFFAFQRLVSMGPDDVNRLIEDLGIDYENQSALCPKSKIPKQILDDCWSWQLTNVVGVIRFGLFYVLALRKKETAARQKQERLQQGKVKRTEEQQHEKALVAALEETAKKEKEARKQEKEARDLAVKDMLQKGEYAQILQMYQNEMDGLTDRYVAKVSNIQSQLKAVVNDRHDVEATQQYMWTTFPKYDLPGHDVCSMPAFTDDDVDKVKKFVVNHGFSGFSVWAGNAYIKNANHELTEHDFQYMGFLSMYTFYIPSLGAKAMTEIKFTDTDGDEVHLKLESGRVNEYENGRLTIEGVQTFDIDEETRTYIDDTGSGEFRADEDLVALVRKRDMLLQARTG